MKNLFTTFFLTFSLGVFANVGDTASYDIDMGGDTGSIVFTIDSLNAQTGMYTVEQVLTDDKGNAQTSTEEADKVMTHESAAQMILFCPFIGGTLENITVASETINTCKVSGSAAFFAQLMKQAKIDLKVNFTGNGTVWFGDIPVTGLAKAELDDGSKMELTAYSWAN